MERITHFSHPHPLHLIDASRTCHMVPPLMCAACTTNLSGWTYACSSCSFFIHASCARHPKTIVHSAHFNSSHHLALHTVPAHPGGIFWCDGCGHHGNSFSYRCTLPSCDFDLHIVCASKPLVANHHSHPHPLSLASCPPYQNSAFICNVCSQTGSNHWLYRCSLCNFNAHMSCVKSEAAANNQHQSALPSFVSGFPGVQPQINYPRPVTASFAAGMAMAVANGSAAGATQQVTQSLIQDVTAHDGVNVYDASDAASFLDFI
ncbi:hypothetical protein SAY87_026485 [Trapa incisa]|uniref:DC1 domain-containing protein n=1 Tax=Trapa incisa TaxID=236973 RepID=A0AAN7GLY4_9MYRT|nr:hypothetical protein SAY87_026485 [Trapa incisa]